MAVGSRLKNAGIWLEKSRTTSYDMKSLFIKGYLKNIFESPEQAEDLLKRLPKSLINLNNLGNVQCERKEYEIALKTFDQLLKLRPDSFIGFLGRGNALFSQKKFNSAVKAYEMARDTWQNAPISEFSKLSAIEGSEINTRDEIGAKIFFNLGKALYELHDLENAKAAFEKSKNLNSEKVNVLNDLAVVYHELGLLDEAISLLNDALSIDPDYHVARHNLETFNLELHQTSNISLHKGVCDPNVQILSYFENEGIYA